MLSDTPEATALYLYLPNMAQATTDEIDAMIQTSNLPAWKWQIVKRTMPPLPEKKIVPVKCYQIKICMIA